MSLILGIDTSNYKTSVALVSEDGRIVADERRFLSVKKGERGLRQQEALFQHVNALPELIGAAFSKAGSRDVVYVAASERPRPVEGSYMPVFNAGVSAAKSIAAALGCPYGLYSHQEMHLAAARHGSVAENWERFIAFHLSGGTTEALIVNDRKDTTGLDIDIAGGTRDIAFGQVLDRAGVAMGLDFPAGEELDRIALSARCAASKSLLPKIKVNSGYINLSGIETACLKALESASHPDQRRALIRLLFDRIADSMRDMIKDLSCASGINKVLLSGGVASSSYIRDRLGKEDLKGINLIFADPALSSDNAVGTALMGRRDHGA